MTADHPDRRDFLKTIAAAGTAMWTAGVAAAGAAPRYDPAATFEISVREVELRRTAAGRTLMARIYQPAGAGPFPLLIFHHGSTGRGTDPTIFANRYEPKVLIEWFTARGWAVVLPSRRGRGGSEGRYDEGRIAKVSGAIQADLMNTLRVPPEDFYQLIFELPKNRLLHTPSFVGMNYTDDLIILDVTFIQGRPKETRLKLLKDINTRVAAAAGVSPDDMLITIYEVPGENISFGQGEAQRANVVAHA